MYKQQTNSRAFLTNSKFAFHSTWNSVVFPGILWPVGQCCFPLSLYLYTVLLPFPHWTHCTHCPIKSFPMHLNSGKSKRALKAAIAVSQFPQLFFFRIPSSTRFPNCLATWNWTFTGTWLLRISGRFTFRSWKFYLFQIIKWLLASHKHSHTSAQDAEGGKARPRSSHLTAPPPPLSRSTIMQRLLRRKRRGQRF